MAIGFGVDVSTTPDFDGTGRMVSGPRVMMEMALRRLTTPNGTLEYDPDFGFDVGERVDDDFTPSDLVVLGGQIALELTKDERVLRCRAVCTLENDVLRIRIGMSTELGDFSFTLGISDVTADILQEN